MEFDRVRERLIQLQELSQDPEYDRYLAQMIKDLDAGKATPEQVEQEAQRSYRLYQQRMQSISHQSDQEKKHSTEREVEFKVGIHAFGLIGAVFVLVAVIIFCFNFQAQGLNPPPLGGQALAVFSCEVKTCYNLLGKGARLWQNIGMEVTQCMTSSIILYG